ncbi:unnamed protein product [Bursaphelenchus xylophilus]|uniref:(pine wood nematode) hypothetical protein n=1 Tax=Bursaphelenchus xylophilus TaxID=6326 RepID=A0A1I7RQM1_BURXY|nr:unnamed protein product [Bursaphelenchus xylophilus]CAG9104816.1 unnamed protein product [Bursaphelenchus xylophilus]
MTGKKSAQRAVFLLVVYCLCLQAFNIDTKQPLIHRGQPASGFGYSIDFYKSGNTIELLSGAPFGRTNQRDIQKGGTVYKCETTTNRCAEIVFDRTGNERRLNGSRNLPIEEKSYQMFGATVIASKNGDGVLACAPHYKYFFSRFEVVEPVGTCFYATENFNRITEFAPCRQEPARHGRHRFGYGMCGFSAAIPNNGDKRLYISAPGVWYWQGAVFSQNINNATDRPETPAGPADTDNSYLGYASATGDFDGDNIDDIVVGAPRANSLIGQVTILDEKLNVLLNLTDPKGQRGQYYGAAVVTTDLNKDGKVDLIVGSPFYTDYKTVLDAKTQEHKPQYDIGKVYVYIQTGARTFKEPIQLKGHEQWGRFGHALAAAGDLNGDGFNDFIVGAPYDGENRQGAVYVYHGSEEGVRKEHTQRIHARDVAGDLRTFGFSLAAGTDVDRNDYPDIAIGSMDSAKAVILKTKPVIQITGFVKTTRKTINLDDKTCVTEFGRLPCEKVKFCLKFGGKTQHNNVDVKVQVNLDSKNKQSPRAFFARKDLDKKRGVTIDKSSVSREQPDLITQNLVLTKNREVCETYDVYVPETIRDKISPILINVNYTYQEKRAQPGQLEPAVDTTLPQAFVTELTIEKDCGDDNVCVPDLQVRARTNKEKFTVGAEDKTVTLNVTVDNKGEDSYLTQMKIEIPKGFEYGGVESYDNKHKVSCTPTDETKVEKDESAPQEFICEVGNPLPANERADFGVKLTGENVDANKEFVEVKMSVNSTNPEESGSTGDNDLTVKIPIEVKAQLSLIGRSNPEQVDYSIRNRTLAESATFDFEVGPVVSHLFQVINRGPSVINGAKLDIFWPSFSDKGKTLLYLIDMPFVSDPLKARCQVKQGANVNPAGLAISNQHVPTQSSLPDDDEGAVAGTEADGGYYADEGEDFEDDRVPYEHEDEPEYNKDEEYESNYRKKRAARRKKDGNANRRQPDALKRKLREQKHQMREAVQRAKEVGKAHEYRGPLNPNHLNCASLNCTQISCDIGELAADEYVLIEVFSRLWLNSLIDSDSHEAEVSSLAFAQITSLPYAPKYQPPPQVIAVTTNVNPIDPESIGWGLPWWLWLLAILIGLLLLLLIIYCCWRCGFFKRNRPQYEKAQFNRESYDDY